MQDFQLKIVTDSNFSWECWIVKKEEIFIDNKKLYFRI